MSRARAILRELNSRMEKSKSLDPYVIEEVAAVFEELETRNTMLILAAKGVLEVSGGTKEHSALAAVIKHSENPI